MTTQTVKNGALYATVTNSDQITQVVFSDRYANYHVRNDADTTIFASLTNQECTEGSDNVISIPQKGSATVYGNGVASGVYVSGPCTIAASSTAINPFKEAAEGG